MGIRHGLQKSCAAALPPVQLHIARNAGVRLGKATTDHHCGVAKSKSKQPTIRKRLHSKLPLDPSCSLHDLTKARENVIILRDIRKAPNPGDARPTYTRKNIPKDLEELRLLNRIEACLYVHLHEVQLWPYIRLADR